MLINVLQKFNYGDVVRLKKDFDDCNLKTGDYGIIWAVYQCLNEEGVIYDSDYEGTFWNKNGEDFDLNFEKEDAEKVLKIEDVSSSREMKDFWLYITQK